MKPEVEIFFAEPLSIVKKQVRQLAQVAVYHTYITVQKEILGFRLRYLCLLFHQGHGVPARYEKETMVKKTRTGKNFELLAIRQTLFM